MRIERDARGSGFGFILFLSLSLPACGSILQTNTDGGGGDGGNDAGRVACRELGEAACRARTDCAAGACSICGGPGSFISCYDPAVESGPICAALTIACPAPCSSHDEASCRARTDCRVDACPNCNGGSGFIRCAALDDPPAVCAQVICPPPLCGQLASKDACEARSDCHSVYYDARNCACAAPGCCARWSRCADGATAACKAPAVACDAVAPHCEGPYVVAYTDSCYEGCVLSTDCAVR